MPCYHPNKSSWFVDPQTGQVKWTFDGPAVFDDPRKMSDFEREHIVFVPCKRCIGCQLDYSRQWADRMLLEFDHTKKAVFVTLTYDNNHVPIVEYRHGSDMSIDISDIQKFMKRLRKRLGLKIRYFVGCEYGPMTHRPHYHLILFGIDRFDIGADRFVGQNELGQPYYYSKFLNDVWGLGPRHQISDVSWKTFAYTSRYVLKKVGKLDDDFVFGGPAPERSLMSRNPGLGGYYLVDHPEACNVVNISDGSEVKRIVIPHNLVDKVLDDPQKRAIMKAERKQFASDKLLMELFQTNLSIVEVRSKMEESKLQRTKVIQKRKDV